MLVQLNVSVVLLFFCRFPSNNQCSTHGKWTLVILTNHVISFSNQAKEQSEATDWQLYTIFGVYQVTLNRNKRSINCYFYLYKWLWSTLKSNSNKSLCCNGWLFLNVNSIHSFVNPLEFIKYFFNASWLLFTMILLWRRQDRNNCFSLHINDMETEEPWAKNNFQCHGANKFRTRRIQYLMAFNPELFFKVLVVFTL